MLSRMPFSGLATCLLALVPATSYAQTTTSELAAHITKTMQTWDIAGLAVAIVKDGRIVVSQGFGVRDVRTKDPVDENTIFAIGSMTKSVTAIAAGTLVDRGKLSWDDLLSRHVPGFAVRDPYVTGAATIRDALSHRTGFDWSIDALMITARTRGEIFERLTKLAPPRPFRTEYNYSNILYIVGSDAVGAAAGSTWEDLVKTAIFQPTGMTRTTTSVSALGAFKNVAVPHRNLGGGPQPIPWGNTSLTSGAGAINASVRDMARLLAVVANDGKLPDASQLLKPGTLTEIFTPQINIGIEPEMERFTNFHSYGLGWELIDYKGRKVAFHGGAIDGMLSQMAVVPSEKLGVVVLTNTDGARNLPDALVLAILDRYLGGEQVDWNTPHLARGKWIIDVFHGTPPRRPDARTTLPLSAYAGTYRGPLGDVIVKSTPIGLAFEYGLLNGALEHWHYDTFRGNLGTYGDRLLTFSMGSKGQPSRITIEFVGDFVRE